MGYKIYQVVVQLNGSSKKKISKTVNVRNGRRAAIRRVLRGKYRGRSLSGRAIVVGISGKGVQKHKSIYEFKRTPGDKDSDDMFDQFPSWILKCTQTTKGHKKSSFKKSKSKSKSKKGSSKSKSKSMKSKSKSKK